MCTLSVVCSTMFRIPVVLLLTIIIIGSDSNQLPIVRANDILVECLKYYKPTNYLDILPNLGMPYIPNLKIPNNMDKQQQQQQQQQHQVKNDQIKPTPTTKVISLKTVYVYKNPVCIKRSRKKKFCKLNDVKRKGQNRDKLITKENFWKTVGNQDDHKMTENAENQHGVNFDLQVSFDVLDHDDNTDDNDDDDSNNDSLDDSIYSSVDDNYRSLKTPRKAHIIRNTNKNKMKTPPLRTQAEALHDLLIEDRLAQLETILPDYKRRRVYETRTIFITKTVTNRRNMATLMVKNCVPLGYEFCREKRDIGDDDDDNHEKVEMEQVEEEF